MVDQVRRALVQLGVTNALSLKSSTNTVIFQDTDGKPDDLPDLVLALSEHSAVFGRGFSALQVRRRARGSRAAPRHRDAGAHRARRRRAGGARFHRRAPAGSSSREPASRRGLPPPRRAPGEKDPALFEAARLQFESFVGRVEGALKATMPEARVEHHHADARVVRSPAGDGAVRRG